MTDKKNLNNNTTIEDIDEEQDQGYSCKSCCEGYNACVIGTFKCFYNTLTGIKNGIVYCFACFWYPMKERCGICCDGCDKGVNPYRDPYFNPYDTL